MALLPFSLDLESLPLFFRYRDVIFGRGFVATIETTGRALCVREEDEFVLAGVEPGGMAVSGSTREAACDTFRTTFTEVLFDIASDAETFQCFKREVELFVHQTSPSAVEEWNRAVEVSRRAAVESSDDQLGLTAALLASVSVVHSELNPAHNVISEAEHLVAF